MPRSAFRFGHSIRVRWSEVDAQGIVFNPHYLTYFDVAATEYWRTTGLVYPASFLEHGVDTFAVKATVEYHRPARYDDVIDVAVRVARLGRTSLRLAVEIYRGEEHLVTGELIYVVASAQERKPTPIPDVIRAAIREYEVTRPEEG